MLLNTRNFFLYLLSLAFLLVAISATVAMQGNKYINSAAVASSEVEVVENYGVEVTLAEPLDRADKLKEMRNKVLAEGLVLTSSPVAESQNETVPTPALVNNNGLLLCADYLEDKRSWLPGPVEFSVVEGARILSPVSNTALDMSSSSLPMSPLLQLPVRSFALAEPSCLPSDVVAVALDGSLIRNNELSLYGIFGQDTLLGYALDGFPLYGVAADLPLDGCGGLASAEGYQYYLDMEREVILNCFASSPVSL